MASGMIGVTNIRYLDLHGKPCKIDVSWNRHYRRGFAHFQHIPNLLESV